MPAFSDIEARAFRAIEATFGEAVLVIPRIGIRGPSGPRVDPDRPSRSVTGIFSKAPDMASPFEDRTNGRNRIGQSQIELPGTALSLGQEAVAALGYAPRVGDAIQLTGRPGAPTYSVSRADLDDLGSVTLFLVAETT